MCIHIMEWIQEGTTIDAQSVNSDTPILCAWCLSEQGIPAGEGSHGICPKHVEQLLQRWEERRARR